jgi:flagellar basal-body rod protein FlgF
MADIAAQVGASLDALSQQFDVIVHNIANVSTVGYKRHCNVFIQTLEAQSDMQDPTSSEEAATETVFDFSQGQLIQTDRKLDVAIQGDGFFVVESPDGPLYTRHGVFYTNQNGQIVDVAGRAVAGLAGPIVVPATRGTSSIHIAEDGRVSTGNALIGQFRIVEFPESRDQLYSAGGSCFRAPEGVEPVDVQTPLVKQGYQEASNVKLIDELVNMIAVSRMYESNMKLISGVQEASSSLMSVAMG